MIRLLLTLTLALPACAAPPCEIRVDRDAAIRLCGLCHARHLDVGWDSVYDMTRCEHCHDDGAALAARHRQARRGFERHYVTRVCGD